MKRYVIFMPLILIFLAFCLSPSFVHGQKSENPEKVMSREDPRATENFLDLTPEQKSKLEEFRKMRQEERREFLRNMRKVRQELRELMRDPEANEKEIKGLYEKIAKLRSSHFTKFVQHRKERRKIFTPEQLEKLEKFKKSMAQRRNFRRARFLGQREFSRLSVFPRRGRLNFFWRRGRYFRGRPFMNRWRQWWRYVN